MKRVESSNILIESFGGTGGYITGSCHKITFSKEGANGREKGRGEDNSFLVDAGLWQGKFEERSERGERRNFEPMKNIAVGITDILASHVHIDHVGKLPAVYKDGFTPRILTTRVTAEFMKPVLENSAEIQESKTIQERLYTNWDVEKAIRHIQPVEPFTMIDIGKKHSNITAEFDLNGHIMGSSSIVITDHRSNKSVLFTGDMGKPNQALGGGYQEYIGRYSKTPIDMLVIESTSFDKEPVSFEEKEKEFFERGSRNMGKWRQPSFPNAVASKNPGNDGVDS